jgi:UDP-3-O-acyl-N-acetylglucosamine deacetylase
MVNTREDLLAKLFDAAIDDLIVRVQSKEATAGDYKNIIQLFKDNGITCEIKKGSPFERLAEVLPFTVEG